MEIGPAPTVDPALCGRDRSPESTLYPPVLVPERLRTGLRQRRRW